MIKFISLIVKATKSIGFSVAIFFYSTFLFANSSFQPDKVIKLINSSYESYFLNSEKIVLKSKEGKLNLDSNEIILTGEVEGRFNVDGEIFNIKTASLSGNLLDKSIISKKKVLFEVNGLEIISSSMEINQKGKEGLKILFKDANLNQVNLESGMIKGKANKIEFFLPRNLIMMEGNAEFYENNMKIISDELHYDLNENRILKSVNAKIINI